MKTAELKENLKDCIVILNDKNFYSEIKHSAKRNFNQYRHDYLNKSFEHKIEKIIDSIKEKLANPENTVNKIRNLIKEKDYDQLRKLLNNVLNQAERFDEDEVEIKKDVRKTISLSIPKKIPEAIREEIIADMSEARDCYENGLYRSCVIICGRLMETALHRKYYEITNNDILETAPGIGLGTLIAKMREKNYEFDPGLDQQIHLINQVRIHSVHKKSKLFRPSKEQAQAIMLFTMDVLNKMFS